MNYKYFLSFAILCTFSIKSKDEAILLTDHVLATIDGIPGIMDEHKIYNSIYLGQRISILQYGEVNKNTKKREPQHIFLNKKYTLGELVKIEHEYQEKYKNIKHSDPAQYEKNMAPLKVLLNSIKQEFEEMSIPFLEEAKGAEEEMKKLIAESCNKRKRYDSHLLNWSKSKNPMDLFRQEVNSFKAIDIFCTDLTNFLKDMIRSCPKALKRYEDWKKQQNK